VAIIGVALWYWSSRAHEPPRSLVDQPSGNADDITVHPDFRGEWQTDLVASDSIAPLAQAKGRSVLVSRIIAAMPIAHVIRGDHRRIAVTVRTPLFEQTEEFPTDGTPTKVVGPDGEEAEAVTRWSEDGRSLITTTTDTTATRPIHVTITRSLSEEPGTMHVDIQYLLSDGTLLQAKRVFRLVSVSEKRIER
jgi:hypothetical protein